MKELKKYFDQISIFSNDSFEQFIEQFDEVKFSKGDFFAQEGNFESKFGILTEGVVRAFFRNQDGLEYNKTFHTPPSFLGAYSSLVTSQKNLINIQALTDSKILVADYPEFVKLFDQNPEFERFARRLAELFFVQKEKREIELVVLNADERYAIFQKEFPTLEQLIPQYHIASYLGVTPTQLSRIRKNLSKS